MKSILFKAIILYAIVLLTSSCQEYNSKEITEVASVNSVEEINITKDSIISLITYLKTTSPDTFIFLNYWIGMPRKFIEITTQINLKNKDFEFSGDSITEDLSGFSYTFKSEPLISSSLYFSINDTTKTLDAIILINGWQTSENKRGGGLGIDPISQELTYFTKQEVLEDEIKAQYKYFEFLFGKPNSIEYDVDFFTSILHFNSLLNPLVSKSPSQNHLYHTFKKLKSSPDCIYWSNQNRFIQSVLFTYEQFEGLDESNKELIGTETSHYLIFTHIEYLRELKRKLKQSQEDMNRLKEIEQQNQKNKI